MYVGSATDLTTWPNRLAHASLLVVKKTLTLCNIPFNDNKVVHFHCDAYFSLGKSNKLSFSFSLSSSTITLGVIHSGLWVPPIMSWN